MIYAVSVSRRELRACRLLASLLRQVFLVRAFTTCWGSDLPHSGVEVAFARDRDLEPLVGLLLALRHQLRVALDLETGGFPSGNRCGMVKPSDDGSTIPVLIDN